MRKSFQMRTRKTKLVFWSILPHKITFETSSTQPFTWVRVGLIPGFGNFKSNEDIFSFLSLIWVKAPENRTLAITWGKKDNEPLTLEQRSLKRHKVPKR